jgi:hypothetical protein
MKAAQVVRRSLASLSRTSILCIAVVGLLLLVVVLTRVHPAADSGSGASAASISHAFSKSSRKRAELSRMRFRNGETDNEVHPATTSAIFAEHGAKHHSVAGRRHHDPEAALKHFEIHGGKHPQEDASQPHKMNDPDHSDHRLLHPKTHQAPPAEEKKAQETFIPPGFKLHKMKPRQPATEAVAPKEVLPPKAKDAHLPSHLRNTAIVTMATGDEAARMATALIASLKDVKTQVPNIIVLAPRGGMGSKDCRSEEWKRANHREGIVCSGPHANEDEILGQEHARALRRLGATIRVVDPIPRTPWTATIPGDPNAPPNDPTNGGGRAFWASAFDKLHVFNMTGYKKILWMDADTLVLQNVDHLLKKPAFTAGLTYNCCNAAGPASISGGLWVVEPSVAIGSAMWKLMNGPVPGTDNDSWHWGDMQFVRYYFGKPRKPNTIEPLWPSIDDERYGLIPGFELLPEVRNKTQKEIKETLLEQVVNPVKRAHVGLIPGAWNGKDPLWRPLDITYDQCVGNCECLPGRDAPLLMKTVHFSCLQNTLRKPGGYESEKDFFTSISENGLSCSRFWFALWLEKFSKGIHYGTPKAVKPGSSNAGQYLLEGKGRTGLPAPYWTGAVFPIFDHKADDEVLAARLARHKKEEQEEERRKKAEEGKAFVNGERVNK